MDGLDVILQVEHEPVEVGIVQVEHVLVVGKHVVQVLDVGEHVAPIIELSQILEDGIVSIFSVKVGIGIV